MTCCKLILLLHRVQTRLVTQPDNGSLNENRTSGLDIFRKFKP